MQMSLPGSAIGACRRARAAGTVTHSVMPATASSLAAPPSRKPRVLRGTRAAAISPAERGRQAGLEIRDPVALERAQAGRLAGRGEADELHRWCPPGRRVPTA